MSGRPEKKSEGVEIKFDPEAFAAAPRLTIPPLNLSSLLDRIELVDGMNDDLLAITRKMTDKYQARHAGERAIRRLSRSIRLPELTLITLDPELRQMISQRVSPLLATLRKEYGNLNVAKIAFKAMSDTHIVGADKALLESAGVWETVQAVIAIRDSIQGPHNLAEYKDVIAEHYRDFAGACSAPACATAFGGATGSAREASSTTPRS